MSWSAITDLGDSAVMVPIALVIAAWLSASGAWRGALAWLVLFGTGAFLVICTKVAYLAWGFGVEALDFTGISGHAMSATAVLAVAGYVLGCRRSVVVAACASLLGYLSGVAIGVSRVALGNHSPCEVVAGCVLGGCVAAAAIGVLRQRPGLAAAPAAFAATALALILVLHGHRAPSENLTVRLALYLSGHEAPFVSHRHRAE